MIDKRDPEGAGIAMCYGIDKGARHRGNQDKAGAGGSPRSRRCSSRPSVWRSGALIDVDFTLALRFQLLRSAPFTFGALASRAEAQTFPSPVCSLLPLFRRLFRGDFI